MTTLDYLYLIHEKSQSLYILKSFKAEIELQLGKKIKVVKFYRGDEQYFAKNDKAEMSNLLVKLISMKYRGKGNIREKCLTWHQN